MARLTAEDLRVAEVWRNAGTLPANESSRRFAVDLLGKALDDLDEMHAVVSRLLDTLDGVGRGDH